MKKEPPKKILFIEDIPADAELAILELKKGGLAFVSELVDTREGLLNSLESFSPDIVISDYVMPNFDGMSALLLVRERQPLLPFIVLTGSMNEETAVDCMKAGASDYVIKEHMSRLPFAVLEAFKHGKSLERNAEQENLLRQSEERYRSIFSNTHAVMMIIDPKSGGIVDANQAAVDFYGWPKEELLRKPIAEINTLAPDMLREQMRRAVGSEKKHFQFRHRLADGSIRDVETHAGPVSIGDQVFLLSIVHDISDRIAAQRKLNILSEKLEHYLSNSPSITYSLALESGTSHMTWISENVKSILGYTVAEATARDWWFHNLAQADRSAALTAIPLVLERKSFSQEYRFLRKDRTTVWLRDDKRLVEDREGNTEIVGTLLDISERKSSEDEIRLKSTALEMLDKGMIITDREGSIEWVNTAFESLSGYTRAEAIGRNPGDLLRSGVQDSEFYRVLWDTILAGKSWSGELVNKRKSGDTYVEEMAITPVLGPSKRVEHFIAIKTDVTEKTRFRENLETSLREKEVLLKEIHHRVNNNMQIVTSLLRLSSESIRDTALQPVMEEMNRRISAMSIVHELFYDAGDISRIDFSTYLDHLVINLMEKYQVEPYEIDVIQRTEPVMLDLDASIPAALILSELVSNAIKAIMAGGREESPKGKLSVLLMKSASGSVTIEIGDDGPGLPESIDPATAQSLGFSLIRILSEQLHGSTVFKTGTGTVALLSFPLTRSRKRKESQHG